MNLKSLFRDKKFILTIISTIVWGLVSHGYAMFHKFSYHDDAMWTAGFVDAETYGLGRWGLGIFGEAVSRLLGSLHISTPAINGVIILICIAIILYIMCLKLRIDSYELIVALSGVLVCFPAVTGLFGFIYTSPYYFVGTALGTIGAYLFYTNKNIKTMIICMLLMMISVSLYQANIPINMTVLLLFMMDEVYVTDMKWKDYIVLILKIAVICAGFMILYLGVNGVLLSAKKMELSGYKGINSFGMTDVTGYFLRVLSAYKRFLKPADHLVPLKWISANMFPWSLKYFHILLIAVSVIIIALSIRGLSNIRKMMEIGIITAISPLFAYFIYVMVGEDEVHGLMTFGEAFMFFLPAYFIERIIHNGRMHDAVRKITVILMFIIGFMFARYSNVCYLKADVMQTEAISYYNRLITRIQATEGYTDDTPVVYINDRSKNEEDMNGNKMFDPIYLPPYQGNSIINDFAWEETMELWCGFSPVKADLGKVSDDVVKSMPNYPDAGSIRMIDGTLVVKFADFGD